MSAINNLPGSSWPPIQNGKEKRGGLMLAADKAKLDAIGVQAGVMVGVTAWNSAAIATAHATPKNVTFNTHLFGPVGDAGVHSVASNTDRFIATRTGWWRLETTITFAANVTGVRMAQIWHSGLAVALSQDEKQATQGGNATSCIVVATGYYFATQYAVVQAYQDSGGALNLASASWYAPHATWEFVGY